MSGWRKRQIERLKMTKEEMIELAKKADLTQHENPHFGTYTATTVSLMRFAKLVAEHEREECAKRLDAVGAAHCAENIRARGQE